ncbi:hypothetical protein MNB_SUP05-9-1155 [hydrothermal vent metagenome]|uniref:Uncharacterized protein n=1 Tax=hydrothermal vent metagenome TaxID=652676 RepID=A0A1W1DSQ3_9ZZZZ
MTVSLSGKLAITRAAKEMSRVSTATSAAPVNALIIGSNE